MTNSQISDSIVKGYIRDIHERIYQFIVTVLLLTTSIPKTPQNLILLNQIIRSATSMGANDQEADGTNTRKDFTAKYALVRKEAKETYFWLRLIGDTNIQMKTKTLLLMKENLEIVKIISSIIYNTNKK